MKQKIKYFIIMMVLTINSFGQSKSATMIIQRNTTKSQEYGSEFYFDTWIKSSQNNPKVYMYLTFPNGEEKKYQLDPVRKKKKQIHTIRYSCILVLAKYGKYKIRYSVTDKNNKNNYDYITQQFTVF